ERPTLDQALEQGLNPLPLDSVLGLQSTGAQILDTRDPAEFAAAHLKGSINIGLGGQYATWAGTVLSREDPIVIIAVPGREKEAAVRLGRIGFDHIVGFLQDGLRSVDPRPDLITTTESFSPQYALEAMAGSESPVVIDVRNPGERTRKYIDGSQSIPLSHLVEKTQTLPRDRDILVYCAGGYRSSIAASLLQRSGFTKVAEIAGGLAAWESAHLPLRTP
ncbi:MAG TPA: rhodanese-like domain-containing protein, partial [Candidatus Eremiobacteraceae bacterium]|nr:rhodanese-like domain-containing protein [Candidatus Eremiobacteraceae bacterium]